MPNANTLTLTPNPHPCSRSVHPDSERRARCHVQVLHRLRHQVHRGRLRQRVQENRRDATRSTGSMQRLVGGDTYMCKDGSLYAGGGACIHESISGKCNRSRCFFSACLHSAPKGKYYDSSCNIQGRQKAIHATTRYIIHHFPVFASKSTHTRSQYALRVRALVVSIAQENAIQTSMDTNAKVSANTPLACTQHIRSVACATHTR